MTVDKVGYDKLVCIIITTNTSSFDLKNVIMPVTVIMYTTTNYLAKLKS